MRIVIVDPSRTVRRIVTDLVQQWKYEVCPFPDAAEALDYIQQDDSVRVLITSAELPSMSGVVLCAMARKLLANSRPLYIIMMSSNDGYTKCVEALSDLTDFLYQRDRDYCIGMISSRWRAKGANVCGAGGR